MTSRSIWKGSISFGLVNIPVKLHSTTDSSKDFSFNQLDDKGHRIQYKKWCSVEDKEIPGSEIKKGYQISKDNYVVVEKEDLEKIKIKTTQSIDIKEFIDSKDFDPILIEKSYYVAPEKSKKNGIIDKAYTLFAKVISETNKIAIGKVVLKDREHLVALRAYQRGIVMDQLRYIDEIKPVDEVEDILFGKSHFRRAQKGHIKGEDLCTAYGQTAGGRYLIVFFIRKEQTAALPISARNMNDSERRYYERQAEAS